MRQLPGRVFALVPWEDSADAGNDDAFGTQAGDGIVIAVSVAISSNWCCTSYQSLGLGDYECI